MMSSCFFSVLKCFSISVVTQNVENKNSWVFQRCKTRLAFIRSAFITVSNYKHNIYHSRQLIVHNCMSTVIVLTNTNKCEQKKSRNYLNGVELCAIKEPHDLNDVITPVPGRDC